MSYKVNMGQRSFYGLRGNIHMHTTLSDGTKTQEDLGRIADQAGLDFIIITDHNVYTPGQDGWQGQTLVLVGEEVHDTDRDIQSSHTLCFDIREDMFEYAADPQALIDTVVAGGGFAFLAHPFERDVADFLPEPNISWRDWQVTGFAGIELWNYMSEFKSVLKNKAQAIVYAYAPALAISGPYPETLQKWDELLASSPVAAYGGSDAHATAYSIGPLTREVQPYDYLFRCINTHLLTEEPLTGDVKHDKAIVYRSLRSGQGFIGYEQPAPVAGFTFWARSGEAEATMGETLDLHEVVEVRATTPAPARLRLLRDGQVIAQARGRTLTAIAQRPGVYRLEAYRRYFGKERGWLFSNPIYVR